MILTNYDYCQNIGIQSDLPRGLSSDHYIISFYFQPPEQHHNLAADSPKHMYNYSKANWEGMNQFFHSYNFDQCLHSDNVEFIWDQLKRAIYSAQSLCIPFLPVRSINQPKWFTPTVRHKVKCLHTLKEDFLYIQLCRSNKKLPT